MLAVATISSALLLGACGGSDEEPAPEQDGITAGEDSNGDSPSSDDTGGGAGNGDAGNGDAGNGDAGNGDQGAAADLPPRPEGDDCVDIPVPDDDRYEVYDAGYAVVERDGDRLTVSDMSGADGWTVRASDPDDDVEVEFRHPARDDVLELDVEIDDDQIEAQICADDDDDDDDDD